MYTLNVDKNWISLYFQLFFNFVDIKTIIYKPAIAVYILITSKIYYGVLDSHIQNIINWQNHKQVLNLLRGAGFVYEF